MSLQRQLLLAGLLTLLVPWAGIQFVLELDEALREQALAQLHAQNQRLARQLYDSEQPWPLASPGPVLYAETLPRPLQQLDGYGDDWPGRPRALDDAGSLLPLDGPVAWRAAVDAEHLYLLIRVATEGEVQPFKEWQPTHPHDHIRLYWQRADGMPTQSLVRSAARGELNGALPDGSLDHRVRGAWELVEGGYQVELRLPRPMSGSHAGFTVHSAQPDREPLGPGPDTRLQYRNLALEAQLAPLLHPGQHVWVLEAGGWPLAQVSNPRDTTTADFDSLSSLQVVEQIVLNGLRGLVSHMQPSALRLPEPRPAALPALPSEGLLRLGEQPATLAVSLTSVSGHTLLLQQSLDDLLALSSNTLGRVIARSTLLIVGLLLVLLGYASWLSWRITRLQRAVSASVDPDGRILQPMATSGAGDELGQLSRHFGQLVARVEGYTHYLESFSRRLSHELKTPIAVVRSSLDNLSHEPDVAQQGQYLTRAQQAVDRLSQILQGMSEAARLEQSFDQVEAEPFDLAEMLTHAAGAYQSLCLDHRVKYDGPAQGCPIQGSPELLAQLLDKLVDNARDFCPPGGLIRLGLQRTPQGYCLSVFNEGPPLPAAMGQDLFEPFVSIRAEHKEGHLGQGLQIVQLITRFHRGQVSARNLPEANEVVFEIQLPA
ncbi:MAG: histidine kinase [Marinobacter sp.]|nr:histidine kinase [Marinobacter sp.]